MKRILSIAVAGLLAQSAFASVDPLNIAGTYTCNGYDMHDGGYENSTVVLTLDAKDSEFQYKYGAYHFKESALGSQYTGEAATDGNEIAVYFANTKDKTDRGVGIGNFTHDKDAKGNVTTVFHKFYYEPDYQKGGNGSEVCIKQD